MPVPIHGKDYETVAERVKKCRDEFPGLTLETQLIHQDDYKVIFKALCMDGDNLLSTGYAEEMRTASGMNATSCLEVAETSAVGRALAFFKYAGTEIRSADEMRDAISQQELIAAQIRGVEIGKVQAGYRESIEQIKSFLADGDYLAAFEQWHYIDDDDKKLLWVAPSKGGCFTTEERKQMQSEQWTEARGVFHESQKG